MYMQYCTFEVNSSNMVNDMWCVKHKEPIYVYASADGWLELDCSTCEIEASFGCDMDKIKYCDKHGMNVGPNKICCNAAGELIRKGN